MGNTTWRVIFYNTSNVNIEHWSLYFRSYIAQFCTFSQPSDTVDRKVKKHPHILSRWVGCNRLVLTMSPEPKQEKSCRSHYPASAKTSQPRHTRLRPRLQCSIRGGVWGIEEGGYWMPTSSNQAPPQSCSESGKVQDCPVLKFVVV